MPRKRKSDICPQCGIVHSPCDVCGKIYHDADWPWCPHGSTRRTLGSIEPVLIFRAADGRIRIPGSNQAKTPRGYERLEIRDIQTLAKFDSRYREQLRRESADLRTIHDECFSAFQKQQRAELRQAMQSMNPFGRALAEYAMKKSDERRRPNDGDFAGGFQVLHYNASEREAHRDAATGWRPRQV